VTVWVLNAVIARADKWDVVREHVHGKIFLIVESVIDLAREYGVLNLMRALSRLVTDPFLLEQIVSYAPWFTATAFNLAGGFSRADEGLPAVLNFVLNQVVCLKDDPTKRIRSAGRSWRTICSRLN
jgi:hypothetical protein